jgi:hypothetical protein
MCAFEGCKYGSVEFWKKMEELLVKEIDTKRSPLDKEQAL